MSSEPILAVAAQGAPMFVTEDGVLLLAALRSKFEGLTGRALSDVQVEMLLLETASYLLSLRAISENHAIAQCFVAWAEGDFLDAHGADRNMPRQLARAATVTLQLTRAASADGSVYVPAGTRVQLGDIQFQTISQTVLTAAQPVSDVSAEALMTGREGNNAPTAAVDILDPVPGLGSAAALSKPSGGADREDDDRYRARLATAFLRINRGGSRAAYRALVMEWRTSVIDVAVLRPEPCKIHVYPLIEGGFTAEDAAEIQAMLYDDRAPQGDEISVLEPITKALAFTLRLRLADPAARAVAAQAVDVVTAAWRAKLGGVVAPSDVIVAARSVPGVVDAGVDFQSMVLADNEWADGSYVIEVVQ